MIFQNYPKGDTIGSGSYVFRHYGDTGEMSRFAQFVEGTLEELTEADFDGITTLSVACLSCSLSTSASSDGVAYLGSSEGPSLTSITIPDTVTTLERPSSLTGTIMWLSECSSLTYIKFPENFPVQSKQNDVVCYSLGSGAVVDCSDYTAVPTLNMYNSTDAAYTNSAMPFSGVTIRVPSSLSSSWQTAWANHAKNAKYEEV